MDEQVVAYLGSVSSPTCRRDADTLLRLMDSVTGEEPHMWATVVEPGPGALSRPGIAEIDPTSGLATSWNPTRSLGVGATDLLLTDAGLWIASDNFSNGQAQMCGGVWDKGGICFLPSS